MEYNKEEYKKNFVADILKAASQISEKARKGKGSYIVTSSNIASNFITLILKHKSDKRVKTINKLLNTNE